MYNSKEKNLSKNTHKLISKEEVLPFLVDENINYVLKELNEYLCAEDSKCCDCLNCILDILALTLNNSSSRYRLLGRHAHKNWVDIHSICRDIRVSLKEAVAIVKERPHHE